MNHETIERDQVMDRYLMGRLSGDELTQFEEHYLDCESCLEQLELAGEFQQGMKQVVAEDAAGAVQLGVLAWIARAARSPRFGLLAAGAILAVLLPSAYLAQRVGKVSERAAELEAELASARSPQANTLLLPLSPERSAPGGEPAARIRLPEIPGWIVLSLELDRPEFREYGIALVGPEGETLAKIGGLAPNNMDALSVSLHSSQLAPGDYEVRAEGVGDTASTAAGRFSFRVVSPE